MIAFEHVLILGTGPVSIQLAVALKKNLNCSIGIVGRESIRSEPFFASLEKNGQRVRVDVQNEKDKKMAGECRVDHVFNGYDRISGSWDTLFLSVTADAYREVLEKINDDVLGKVKCLVLISPTFGSSILVEKYMNERHVDAEVISFSTYLGDTRRMSGAPSNHVITTGVKKKLYIGSTAGRSANLVKVCDLFEGLGVTLAVMDSPLEAETRNISLYVHPPLFMNDFTLAVIFNEGETKKFVYKLFPEGPITQRLIREMLFLWKEVMHITAKLNIQGINLLKFMVDDNYPVRLESLSRQDIEDFEQLEAIHQEYLLYIRYASLLIDPFSTPDQEGRYFDFSAVPIREMFVNKEGYLDIPRMPKEDYYRLKIIQGISNYLDSSCPIIDAFITRYEQKIKEVADAHKESMLSEAFIPQNFENDLHRICDGLENRFGDKLNSVRVHKQPISNKDTF